MAVSRLCPGATVMTAIPDIRNDRLPRHHQRNTERDLAWIFQQSNPIERARARNTYCWSLPSNITNFPTIPGCQFVRIYKVLRSTWSTAKIHTAQATSHGARNDTFVATEVHSYFFVSVWRRPWFPFQVCQDGYFMLVPVHLDVFLATFCTTGLRKKVVFTAGILAFFFATVKGDRGHQRYLESWYLSKVMWNLCQRVLEKKYGTSFTAVHTRRVAFSKLSGNQALRDVYAKPRFQSYSAGCSGLVWVPTGVSFWVDICLANTRSAPIPVPVAVTNLGVRVYHAPNELL